MWNTLFAIGRPPGDQDQTHMREHLNFVNFGGGRHFDLYHVWAQYAAVQQQTINEKRHVIFHVRLLLFPVMLSDVCWCALGGPDENRNENIGALL